MRTKKISTGLLVDATPNSLNLDHNNNVTVSERIINEFFRVIWSKIQIKARDKFFLGLQTNQPVQIFNISCLITSLKTG